ncbi:glycosyltransferase [Flavihumibacter stibioxidans]|uniref:Glycosyltransferase n=1 Tax=Flavihumibacter stibioxidans TaxID=1834163 RepID=A0ABR7M6X1_9BACT|nr:glycosyltransferase [Flavihumibacter stibioxidans]MBC6490788.1 hypothetical protein [Flavihumibacter stibioxidans]
MKQPGKKYWLLSSEYPPVTGGGISTYCQQTASMLEEAGFSVTIFLPNRNAGYCDITFEDSGRRIIQFNPQLYPESNYLGYETVTSYAIAKTISDRVVEEGAPYIIESQEYNGLAYFLLLFRYLKYDNFKSLRILITIHAPSFICLRYNHHPYYRLPYFWLQEMEKFCLQAADLLIAPSTHVQLEILQSYPELTNKIHLVRNPYTPATKPVESVVRKMKQWAFYGKAAPLKGIFELLALTKKIWTEIPEFSLTIIGGLDYYYYPEGDLMGNIIRRMYRPQIENGQLRLAGNINHDSISKHLAEFEAVVIPSRFDNLPYAALELMADGKIILAARSGGHAELIEHGENGFLFDLAKPESFYAAFGEISNLQKSDRIRISQKARDTIETATASQTILKQKTDLIDSIGVKEKTGFPFIRPVLQHAGNYQNKACLHENARCSVIVPYFNMGKYLEECISSIIGNGSRVGEILIVDDGSFEEISILKLNEIKSRFPIVRIIRQENCGLAVARNTGALHAKESVLAFLDPDDMIMPDYYNKAIKILEQYRNVHFVSCWAKYFGTVKGYWPSFNPEPPLALIHNMMNTSCMVVKKECYLAAGQNDPAMIFGMEDYDSMLGMLERGFRGVVIPEALFLYRVRNNSMSRHFNREKKQYLYQLIANKHKQLFNQYGSEVSNLLNANGPGYQYDNPTIPVPETQLLNKLLSNSFTQKLKSNPLARKLLVPIYRRIK